MDAQERRSQDERYIAIEHMEKVRPGTGREASLGYVRRDCVSFARYTNEWRGANQFCTAQQILTLQSHHHPIRGDTGTNF